MKCGQKKQRDKGYATSVAASNARRKSARQPGTAVNLICNKLTFR
jgi:hypothetical protein